MKKILIPLDGSELAESALEPGLRLAARHGSEVILATVVSDLPPVPLATGDGEMVSRWFREEEDRAGQYLDRIRERVSASHPDVEVATRVSLGPVARTLMDEIEESGVEIACLTTHGRGAWQRAWLGSVADALLRGAGRPLLLLREGEASTGLFADETSPSHAVVPLDGSSAAEEVLGPLTSLLPGRGGTVTLVSVARSPFPLATTYLPHAIEAETVAEEQKERTREYLREVAERWNPVGVHVGVEILASDDPARAIMDFASKQGADLLALNTRGRGGVGRMILGSVADKILRGTRIPVLAVRRGGAEME
jgi:nucleotide-binding universal stress UspA family protein